MSKVRRIYVEKKAPYAGKAKELRSEIKSYLGISSVSKVRVFIRYDVENISDEVFEKACTTVFSEPPVDILYREEIEIPAGAKVFSVEAFKKIQAYHRAMQNGQMDEEAGRRDLAVSPFFICDDLVADHYDIKTAFFASLLLRTAAETGVFIVFVRYAVNDHFDLT